MDEILVMIALLSILVNCTCCVYLVDGATTGLLLTSDMPIYREHISEHDATRDSAAISVKVAAAKRQPWSVAMGLWDFSWCVILILMSCSRTQVKCDIVFRSMFVTRVASVNCLRLL